MGVVSFVCGSPWGKEKTKADVEFYFNLLITVNTKIFPQFLRVFTYSIVDISQMCLLSRFS